MPDNDDCHHVPPPRPSERVLAELREWACNPDNWGVNQHERLDYAFGRALVLLDEQQDKIDYQQREIAALRAQLSELWHFTGAPLK